MFVMCSNVIMFQSQTCRNVGHVHDAASQNSERRQALKYASGEDFWSRSNLHNSCKKNSQQVIKNSAVDPGENGIKSSIKHRDY